jgi:NACalpha-BTF3-like transcription factor
MKVMSDRKAKEAHERQIREKELAKVKINKEDVDLIVS